MKRYLLEKLSLCLSWNWTLEAKRGKAVHFALFEICTSLCEEIGTLVNRHEDQERILRFRGEALDALSRDKWPALLQKLLKATKASPGAPTALYAGWLQAFDRIHQAKRGWLEHQPQDFRPVLDDAQVLFLPSAENLLDQWRVPASRLAERRIRYPPQALRSHLGLYWMLIRLDTMPVKPISRRIPNWIDVELGRRLEEGDFHIGVVDSFQGLAEAQLREVVKGAREAKIDLLCFPELALDSRLTEILAAELGQSHQTQRARLHPLLVVAGSVHIRDQNDQARNRCRILDGYGTDLFPHFHQDKCIAPPPRVGGGGEEEIQYSRELLLFDARLGRLASLIGYDYCSESLTELLALAEANFLIAPARVPSSGPFKERAQELAALSRATSLFVNNAWRESAQPESEDTATSFLHLPLRSGLSAQPDRLARELGSFQAGVLARGGKE